MANHQSERINKISKALNGDTQAAIYIDFVYRMQPYTNSRSGISWHRQIDVWADTGLSRAKQMSARNRLKGLEGRYKDEFKGIIPEYTEEQPELDRPGSRLKPRQTYNLPSKDEDGNLIPLTGSDPRITISRRSGWYVLTYHAVDFQHPKLKNIKEKNGLTLHENLTQLRNAYIIKSLEERAKSDQKAAGLRAKSKRFKELHGWLAELVKETCWFADKPKTKYDRERQDVRVWAFLRRMDKHGKLGVVSDEIGVFWDIKAHRGEMTMVGLKRFEEEIMRGRKMEEVYAEWVAKGEAMRKTNADQVAQKTTGKRGKFNLGGPEAHSNNDTFWITKHRACFAKLKKELRVLSDLEYNTYITPMQIELADPTEHGVVQLSLANKQQENFLVGSPHLKNHIPQLVNKLWGTTFPGREYSVAYIIRPPS